jgi:hypothetical protein
MITWPRRSCREAVLAVLLSLILSVKSVASQAGIKSLEVLLLDSPPFTCNDQVSCLGLRGVRSRTSACPRLMQNGGQWLRLGTSYARSLTLLAASSHAFLRTVLPKSSGWAANLAAAGRRTACAYTVSRCDRLPSLRASRTGAPWHTLYSWHTMLVFSRSIPWGDPTDWMRLVKA